MQFAVKKLTMSDLTFFAYQFRRYQAEARAAGVKGSKQKGINLNQDVFIEVVFPLARGEGQSQHFALPLSIYGPGMHGEPQILTRKVVSPGGGGKNWRLNGELVPDPDFDPTRYHGLEPGDLALFGFEGGAAPSAILLLLVSQQNPDDDQVFASLRAYLGNRSMSVLNADTLSSVVALSPESHAIRELYDPEAEIALEDASLGSVEGVRRLRARRAGRRMSAEALRDARARAEAIGRSGEVLVDAWLQQEVDENRLASAFWTADSNAINPWDFDAVGNDGAPRRIEVKATAGDFQRPIHISQAEIESAAQAVARTDLYRVYDLNGDTASLRICENIGGFATDVLANVAALGEGVIPDGYTVKPERLGEWGPVISLRLREDAE